MSSPLSMPCKGIIFLNSLFLLGAASHSIPISLIPPPIQYCPNPLSVFPKPICPSYNGPNEPPKHHPWDSEPTCLQIINNTGEHKYCIHSSKSFANGRGISVLTTPEIGSSIGKSAAFQQASTPFEFESSKKTYPYDTYVPPTYPPFEVKDIPGKGKGLIANQTLHFGDIITYNHPLLIVDRRFFDSEVGLEKEQRLGLLRDTVTKLPPLSQKKFFEQCTRESGIGLLTGTPPQEEIEDILKTNSFSGHFKKEGEEEQAGILHGLNIPESSRLNHDCRPNTYYAFDPSTLTHKIHAIATINPGEEITTSYLPDPDPYPTRQTKLSKHWGFTCTCNLCMAEEKARMQSDSRLSLISKYRDYLQDWSYESAGTPELAEKYLQLLQAERLYHKLGEAYCIAALRFSAWEKEEEAKKYAEKAVEMGLWWNEDEAFDLREIETIRRMGRNHWSWGLGRKLRIGQDGTSPVGEQVVAVAGMRLVKQEKIVDV